MNHLWSRLLVLAFAGCVLFQPLAGEAVPALFDHQGRLKDSTGAPLTGTHILTFRLYNVATGGAALWTDPEVVLLNEGVYSVNLPIDPAQFDGAPYWLSVQVDSDAEIPERVQIVSVPYAARAAAADSAVIGGGWTQSGTTVVLNDTTSPVGIGTSAPARGLHVVAPSGDLFAGRFESAHPNALSVEYKNSSNNITWEHAVAGSAGAFGGLVPSGSMYFWRQGSPVVAVVSDSNGNTGLGDAPTDARLHVKALEGQPLFQVGLDVESNNSLATGIGINVNAAGSPSNYGTAISASGGNLSVGIWTSSSGSTDDAYGVQSFATADSVAYGVYGEAEDAVANYGVMGKANGNGLNTVGVYGEAIEVAPVGGTGPIGVRAVSQGISCYGMESRATGASSIGLLAVESGDGGIGAEIIAQGQNVIGLRVTELGLNGIAARLQGDVHVSGTLTKGGGAFRIDHPLDPANKYLQHSFVESPDMKNIYDGVAVLDADGRATVILPAWFDALNEDFRYQLTCVGGYAPVYIESKIANNQFVIAGGTAGLEVSWQVTGIRKDAFAEANRIEVEVAKVGDERDRYLYPEALGFDETRGMDYERLQRILSSAPPPVGGLTGTQQR